MLYKKTWLFAWGTNFPLPWGVCGPTPGPDARRALPQMARARRASNFPGNRRALIFSIVSQKLRHLWTAHNLAMVKEQISNKPKSVKKRLQHKGCRSSVCTFFHQSLIFYQPRPCILHHKAFPLPLQPCRNKTYFWLHQCDFNVY